LFTGVNQRLNEMLTNSYRWACVPVSR
jgi:hypothetical protein